MFIRNLVSVQSSCLNMIQFLLVTLFMHSVFGAEYTLPGACPEIRAQENLSFSRFSGLWYVTAGYASDGRNISDCATLDFQEDNMGYIMTETYVDTNSQDHNIKRSYIARVDPTFDAGNRALFIVSYEAEDYKPLPYQPFDKVLQFPFLILATDYDNFAVAYYCKWRKGSESNHYVFTWILTRNKEQHGSKTLFMIEEALSKFPEVASKWKSFTFKDFSSSICTYSDMQVSDVFTKNFW